ncbi:MAG TPA: GldG family protein [Acidiferrobacter sp.]|nr:GldG family protein [Acidiferrobacter sp.]
MKWQRMAMIGNQATFIVLWLLVAGLALYAGDRYHYQSDWTANNRNSLTAPSVGVVKALREPVTIDAFAHGAALRRDIRALIGKYQRVDPQIQLTMINPDKHPALVRRLGVTFNGELQIHYGKRSALVLSPTEAGVTNILARLQRTGLRHLIFLTGNGERRPDSQAVLGLSTWARRLKARGFQVSSFDLGAARPLTPKVGVLIIADPRIPFLVGEIRTLKAFVQNGGDVLWLLEPGHTEGLAALAKTLGIHIRRGFAVDPTSMLLTGTSPDFIAVNRYPNAGPVHGMHLTTVFPTATTLTVTPVAGLHVLPILRTGDTAWQQRKPLAGIVQPPHGVTPKSLTLGVALERARRPGQQTQRLIILGDSDFASNSFIGEGGNLTLAMNLANWIAHDDAFINLPNRAAPDLTLVLTRGKEEIMAFGFLLILPIVFLAGGLVVWWRRRRL